MYMGGKLIDKLSVFLPTYNEEGNIEKTVKNVKDTLEKVADNWEIIIVDDGSHDNTPPDIRQDCKW